MTSRSLCGSKNRRGENLPSFEEKGGSGRKNVTPGGGQKAKLVPRGEKKKKRDPYTGRGGGKNPEIDLYLRKALTTTGEGKRATSKSKGEKKSRSSREPPFQVVGESE